MAQSQPCRSLGRQVIDIWFRATDNGVNRVAVEDHDLDTVTIGGKKHPRINGEASYFLSWKRARAEAIRRAKVKVAEAEARRTETDSSFKKALRDYHSALSLPERER